MFDTKKYLPAIGVLISSFILASCGGGGGASTSNISGTIATGAPIKSGTVSIFDADGSLVSTGSISSDGNYDISVPTTATAPLILRATFDGQDLFSVKADATSGIANINQLTTGVAALITPSGDPSVLVNKLSDGATISTASIDTAVAKITAAIKPASDAIVSSGQPVGNFLTTAFTANGTGIDKLLDTSKLALTSVPSGATSVANIAVTFNTSVDVDDTSAREPKGLQFIASDSETSVAALASNVSIAASELPPAELGTLYHEFITRMNACYSLPVASRGTKGSGSSWAFTISAQACKDIFYGSDPSNYLDAGHGVGYARFAGMASDVATILPASESVLLQNIGRNLSTGKLEGKALINFRGVGGDGNFLNAQVVVKMFDLNGRQVMGAYGDHNASEFYVNSAIEAVHHPLTDGSNDYLKSSYQVVIPSAPPQNTLGEVKGRSDIDYVELTTPTNKTVYLKPWGTRSNVYICKDQTNKTSCTVTAHFVQALRFVSDLRHANGEGPWQIKKIREYMYYSKTADTAASCPQFALTGDPFFTGSGTSCPRSDEEIEAQRAGGLWTATYHFLGGTTSNVLRYRNPVRAMSSRELISSTGPDAKAAKLTSATIQRLVGYSEASVSDGRAPSTWVSNATKQSPIWSPASGGYAFDWTVAEGQIPPRKMYVLGQTHYHDPNSPDSVTWSTAWGGGNRPFIFWSDSDTYTATGSDGLTSGDTYWYPRLRPSWDESLSFKTSSRSASVTCSPAAGSVDLSCAGSSGGTWGPTTGTVTRKSDGAEAAITLNDLDTIGATSGSGPDFARGSWMTYAHLWTKDESGRNLQRGYNFYNPY